MLKIEKGIPLPSGPGTRTKELHDTLKAMDTGDSFFTERFQRATLYYAAARQGYKVSIHREGKGLRVWKR